MYNDKPLQHLCCIMEKKREFNDTNQENDQQNKRSASKFVLDASVT